MIEQIQEYYMEVALGALSGATVNVYRKNKAVQILQLMQTRSTLINLFYIYYEKGYIYQGQKDNWIEMYSQYKILKKKDISLDDYLEKLRLLEVRRVK